MHGKSHLELMHQQKQSKRPASTDVNSNGAGCESKPKKQCRLDEEQPFVSASKVEKLIIDFVVQDLQPLSIVEGAGFRRMIEGLNSKAKVMCTTTLKDRLETLFSKMTEKIKITLHDCEFVCTTADIWTQQARSYLGVTCHWIDPGDLQRHSIALAFRRFRGVHSYDKIASMMMNIHTEFDLDTSKIVNVVTDNGSNFVKAFREYAEPGIFDEKPVDEIAVHATDTDTVETEEEPVHNAITYLFADADFAESSGIYLPSHLSCFSHTLNLLATTDANKALTDAAYKRLYRAVASKCTSLSNASHQSSKAAEAVFEILGRTIPKPNTTRWNSEYDSYSTILDLKDKINIVMQRLQLPKFSAQEFTFLSEWVEVMRPISQALDKLQGEFTMESFFGSVLPTLSVIQRKLASFTPVHTGRLVSALQAGMDKRFGDILNYECMATNNKLKAFVVAAVSHPFFKVRWLLQTHRNQAEELFTAEVTRIGDSSRSSSESNHADNSSDFYGFQESAADIVDSASKMEALQYLNDPSHEMDQLKRLVVSCQVVYRVK